MVDAAALYSCPCPPIPSLGGGDGISDILSIPSSTTVGNLSVGSDPSGAETAFNANCWVSPFRPGASGILSSSSSSLSGIAGSVVVLNDTGFPTVLLISEIVEGEISSAAVSAKGCPRN